MQRFRECPRGSPLKDSHPIRDSSRPGHPSRRRPPELADDRGAGGQCRGGVDAHRIVRAGGGWRAMRVQEREEKLMWRGGPQSLHRSRFNVCCCIGYPRPLRVTTSPGDGREPVLILKSTWYIRCDTRSGRGHVPKTSAARTLRAEGTSAPLRAARYGAAPFSWSQLSKISRPSVDDSRTTDRDGGRCTVCPDPA
jgi:hypothetical protein